MNKTMLALFTNAHRWNAIAYGGYKCIFTALTFVLYAQLDAHSFSLWANINSTVFLLLLWIDGGMRKSIPQFAASHTQESMGTFIGFVLRTQIILITATLPIFLYVLRYIPLQTNTMLLLGGALFFIEGLISGLRLLFHAYFWNKSFNLLSMGCTAVGMLVGITAAYLYHNGYTVIMWVIGSRIGMGMVTVIVSFVLLKKKLDCHKAAKGTRHNPHNAIPQRQFAKHTIVMWLTSVLRSLTERNFMVPFLTWSVGAPGANLYKVANDATLLLYRFVIKTMGTSDTSLLSHAHEKNHSIVHAFELVTTTYAALCVPLLGVIALSPFLVSYDVWNHDAFPLFIVMGTCLLFETLLLGYERVAEVKRAYKVVCVSYIPSLIVVTIIALYAYETSVGLITLLLCIHGVRLVSLIGLAVYTWYQYELTFPLYALMRVILNTGMAIGMILLLSFA